MQLDPLVKPRSVAIVGATDRIGPGRSVIESLGAIGFTGAIYPVNPKYQTVRNLVCYPTLTDLPEAPNRVKIAATHMSAFGTKRTFGEPCCDVRFW